METINLNISAADVNVEPLNRKELNDSNGGFFGFGPWGFGFRYYPGVYPGTMWDYRDMDLMC